MRYHCIHIKTDFAEEWQKDLFDQQLFDLGVETIDGNDYYIQSEVLKTQISYLELQISNTEGAELLSVEACPDKNWNATWEAEHPIQELPLDIKIIPHCAFGAGHHETTSMMIETLLSSDLKNKSVLDFGTGTGVLAIFAKRLGAARVIAIDIDDKSVENTKENAALNELDIDIRWGDSVPKESYDLILANIHRNILLTNMTSFAECLNKGGELWLSGFYEDDSPALISAAETAGLHYRNTSANGEWRMLTFFR